MVGWHHHSMDMSLSKFLEILKDMETRCAAAPGVTKSQEHLVTEQQLSS